MNCPKCHLALTTLATKSVTADRCANCGSIWIGPFGVEQLVANPGCQSLIQELDDLSADSDAASPYACPNCTDRRLRVHEHDDVEIDWCPNCRGIHFDKGELKKFASSSPERPDNSENDDHERTSAFMVVGEILVILSGLGDGIA